MALKSSVIHSQLITTGQQVLLLPNTAVAEIVHYSAPQPADNAPDWLLGTMEWRGLRLPVISFERAAGDTPGETGAGQRIAVINGVHNDNSLQFYALVIEGNPRLVNVGAESISTSADGESARLQLQQVTVNNIAAVIPDLGALEQLITREGVRSERVH